MNKSQAIMIITSIIALFVTGCSISNEELVIPVDAQEDNDEQQAIRLGYCPTMSGIAQEIAATNDGVSLQAFGSTAGAMQSLRQGTIDAILVGRLAQKGEAEGSVEKRLRDGLTLVGKEKKLILFDELQKSRIHTAVDETLAKKYLPNTENIIFHESTASAIAEGINDVALIDWDDFIHGLELVIPVDAYGNKIERFRLPVVYAYDKNIVNMLTS